MKKRKSCKHTTNNEHSPWKQMVKQIMQDYHLEDKRLQISKEMMKKSTWPHEQRKVPGGDCSRSRKQNEGQKMERKPQNWQRKKTKVHAKTNKKTMQCHTKSESRNATSQSQPKEPIQDLILRFCKQQEEIQEHILIECPTLQPTPNDIDYKNLSDDQDLDQLRKFANHTMATEWKMEDTTWSPTTVRTVKTKWNIPKPSNSNSI